MLILFIPLWARHQQKKSSPHREGPVRTTTEDAGRESCVMVVEFSLVVVVLLVPVVRALVAVPIVVAVVISRSSTNDEEGEG